MTNWNTPYPNDTIGTYAYDFLDNASEEWNWCDDEFCKDIETEWTGLSIEDVFEGIGRLLFETQRLVETLIIWQARYGNIFKKERTTFTREQIESCDTVQKIRNGPWGILVKSMEGRLDLPFEKDKNVLGKILSERNYFVHTFFERYFRGKICDDDLDKECKRLKTAINTIVKFNNRYLPTIQNDIKRMES